MTARRVFACKTLRRELEVAAKAVGFTGELTFLEERLHSEPKAMHRVLQEAVDANRTAEELVICVSGCGRATLGLRATTADLLLPRTMDCIDVLLTGSAARRPEGGIFLTQSWMQFTRQTAICHERLLAEHGQAVAAEKLRRIYRGFTDFYIIDTGTYDTREVAEYLRPLLAILGGRLHHIDGKFGVLYRLLRGEREAADVIHVPRGGRVELKEFAGLRPAVIK